MRRENAMRYDERHWSQNRRQSPRGRASDATNALRDVLCHVGGIGQTIGGHGMQVRTFIGRIPRNAGRALGLRGCGLDFTWIGLNREEVARRRTAEGL